MRLKEILKEKGITQVELASRLGKTKQQINDIVSERVGVSVPMLELIATALNVPTWQLFATTEDLHSTEIQQPFVALVRDGNQVLAFNSKTELKDYVASL